MYEFLQTRVVSEAEFRKAARDLGMIYFARDAERDAIKVGYSADVDKRLSSLQVGNPNRLEIVGLIAAEQRIEPIIHLQLYEGRIAGEWFWDRGVTMQWLMDMTGGEPLRRNVWRLVGGRTVYSEWDEQTQTHTKHYLGET